MIIAFIYRFSNVFLIILNNLSLKWANKLNFVKININTIKEN